MGIYRKVTPSSYPNTPASNFTDTSKNWRQHKNFYIRTDDLQTASLTAVKGRYTDSTRTWRRVKAMYRWNGSVWQKIFSKFAGQPYPETPPEIRYTSYTGTAVEPFAMMGPGASSIAQGASGTTYLWGNDGENWQNDTPLASRLRTFVFNSTPIPDTAAQVEDDEGFNQGDKLANTQAVIANYDGKYIWYKDRITLTNGSSGTSYSQTVRVIKQQPVINSLAFKTNNSVPTGALKYVTYSVANNWYRSIDQNISLLKWYILDTQFETPTEAKLYGSTYISATTKTETTTLLTGEDYFNIPETFNGESTTDKWLYVVLICKNSSSDTDLDYNVAPYNDVLSTPLIAQIGGSGTIGSVTMTANADTITVNWSAASGATKYRIYWTTSGTASPDPSSTFDEEKGNVLTWAWGPDDPDKNTSVPQSGNDYYFYVSASGANNLWSPYVRSALTQSLAVSKPTIVSNAYPVLTRTAGTYNYSVTTGSWTNSPTGYDYEWKAYTTLPYPPYSSTVTVGGNSSTYTSSASYPNWSIYCLVTARNSAGSALTPASSNSITNTELVNPPINQTAPTIQGSGRTFSVSNTGSWNPDDEDGVYLYQWKYNDQGSLWLNIPNSYSSTGSTSQSSITITTSSLDGLGIRCYVTATRGDYPATANSQSLMISAPVIAPTIITNAYPVLSRTSGTYNYSVTNGSWANSPTGYSYKWYASTSVPYPPYSINNLVGTNSSSYTSSASYTNYSIYCIVTASNSAGSNDAQSNAITNTAIVTLPVNQTAPTIQGSGRSFSVSSNGSWNPDDADGVYTYQWKYNDQGSLWLNIPNSYSTSGSTTTSSLTLNTASLDEIGIRCYVTAMNEAGFTTANSQSLYPSQPIQKPTIISNAYPVLTRTAGTYNYSVTTGSWANFPTGYSYQWKAQTSLPYPPYSSTADVGTNSSTYTSSATYLNWSIYCLVTASNSAGSALTAASSNSIQNTAVGSAPSGGSVTLTPSGTQQAGTTITATVSAMSGTSPITYSTIIRKATGTPPTLTTGTGLGTGSGTGAVATHEISDSEASGTPDQFKAFTTASNDFGTTVIESNVVVSTPRVTTTTVNCLTCNSYSPNDGTYPYTTPDTGCTSGSRYYRTCVTPVGCDNTKDLGSCVPAATTTTTAAPTVNCNTCNSYYPADQSYTLVTDYPGCSSGSIYYRICITPGSCPNITQYGNCVPAATTTTTAAPATTTSRPLVYWKCNLADYQNPSNPCGFVGQCLYEGNDYFPAGC